MLASQEQYLACSCVCTLCAPWRAGSRWTDGGASRLGGLMDQSEAKGPMSEVRAPLKPIS